MGLGGSDTTTTMQLLILSLDLKAPCEGDANRSSSVQVRETEAESMDWQVWDSTQAGSQLSQPQANVTVIDRTSPWKREMGSAMDRRSLCLCVSVCLWVHRFYREEDTRHNNKQRGNQFYGQLGKQVLL